jgi:hypothetical protein
VSVIRLDRAKPKKWAKTPAGFLRARASLTGVGVFGYELPDGSVRQELRSEEEVFHPDSLVTLEMLPVVMEHPPERLIDSSTVAKYQKGHAGENLAREGDVVAANVMITHADAVDSVETKKTTQISLGYVCDLRPETGTFRGKPYTHVQEKIRYNHIALTREGRMGSDIGIRLDSADAIAVDLTDDPPAGGKRSDDAMEKVLINGMWIEVPAQAAQALKVEREQQVKNDSVLADRVKSLETQAAEEKKRADTAEGKAAAAEKSRNDSADPKRLDALVEERIALREQAHSVLGQEVKLDGKDAKSIKLEVLKKLDPEASFDGKSDEYLNAYFESAVKHAVKNDSTNLTASQRTRVAAGNAGGNESPAEKAYLALQERTVDAWQKPIGTTTIPSKA